MASPGSRGPRRCFPHRQRENRLQLPSNNPSLCGLCRLLRKRASGAARQERFLGGGQMAWTDQARQRSLERRRERRQSFDKQDWDMAMRVAAAGGGLARLQRCIEAHYSGPYPYPRCDPRPRHHWRQRAYRLVCRMGLREAICRGKFRPGSTQGLVDGRRCPTCHQDLTDSPWCTCVPRSCRNAL